MKTKKKRYEQRWKSDIRVVSHGLIETLVLRVPKIQCELSSRIHGTVDKAFAWKELLSEIIWKLQVQFIQINNKEFQLYSLKLLPGQG